MKKWCAFKQSFPNKKSKKRHLSWKNVHTVINCTFRTRHINFLLWDQFTLCLRLMAVGQLLKMTVHRAAPVPLIWAAARGRPGEPDVLPELQNSLCDGPRYSMVYTLYAFDALRVLQQQGEQGPNRPWGAWQCSFSLPLPLFKLVKHLTACFCVTATKTDTLTTYHTFLSLTQ